ncbi:MAG: hypothetical protein J6P61_07135 [Erysipelotrichaceae bacterium]|nr:hypothetical protein [Erysipelotrichaceae bacterium]
MGLFSRKKKTIDYDQLLKDTYKQANQLQQQARDELDYVIKASLLAGVLEKYDVILDCIDHGAHQDRDYFVSLQEHVKKELETIKSINEDL